LISLLHVCSSIFRPGLIAPWRRELTTGAAQFGA